MAKFRLPKKTLSWILVILFVLAALGLYHRFVFKQFLREWQDETHAFQQKQAQMKDLEREL